MLVWTEKVEGGWYVYAQPDLTRDEAKRAGFKREIQADLFADNLIKNPALYNDPKMRPVS